VKFFNKLMSFRNSHKFSAPTILIGIALIIFPLWGAFFGFPAVTAGIGYGLIFTACLYSLWYFRKTLSLGTKWIWIPLAVMVLFSLLRFIVGNEPIESKLILAVYTFLMFLFYLVIRQKGQSVLWFIVPTLILYSLNAIVDEVINSTTLCNLRAHGLSTNCDTLAALLVFCIFMLRGKWLWLAPLGVIAILLTGSYWVVGGIVVAGVVYIVLNHRNFKWIYSKVSVTIASVVILFCVVGLSTGVAQKIWQIGVVKEVLTGSNYPSIGGSSFNVDKGTTTILSRFDSWTARLSFVTFALSRFSWVGNGYFNNDEDVFNQPVVDKLKGSMPIHNVPAMILDEIGPFAALAWLITMGYGIYKSKRYRYVLIAMLVTSCTGQYDFWYWTSLGSYYYLTMGLVSIKNG